MPLSRRRFVSACRPSPRFARPFSLLFALSLLVSVAPHALAQNVTMKARVGLSEMYRMGDWIPFIVDFENQGNRIEGRLSVEISRPGTTNAVTHAKPVDLAGSSRQRHFVYVRTEDMISKIFVTLEGNRFRKQMELRTRNFRVLQPGDDLLAVLGSQESGLSFLTGTPIYPAGKVPPSQMLRLQGGRMRRAQMGRPIPPVMQSSGGSNQPIGEVRVSSFAQPQDVPDDRRGYDAVDTLVLGDLSLDKLPQERLGAIQDWLRSGGTLLVPGGADVRRLQAPVLADMLPVTVTGVQTRTGVSLPALKTNLAGPLTANAFSIKPDSIPVKGTGNLLIQRQYGLGKVLFLAFDPLSGEMGTANLRPLWQGIMALTQPMDRAFDADRLQNTQFGGGSGPYGGPMGSPYGPGGTSWNFADVAMEMPSVKAPSFNLLGGYLLLYLLLLSPVNFFLLRRFKRPEWAWITVPVVILLFTFGSYGAGYAMKGGNLKFNEISFIQAGSGEERASAMTYLGLFSPRRHSYQITVDNPTVALGPLSPNDYNGGYNPNSAISYTSLQGEKPGLENMSVNMWTVRGFWMEHMTDLEGSVDGTIKVQPGWYSAKSKNMVAQGKITNNTRMKLNSCVLRYGGLSSDSFDLNPGQTKNGPFILADHSGVPPGTSPRSSGDKEWNTYARLWDIPVGRKPTLFAIASPVSLGIRLDGRNPAATRACVLSVRFPDLEAAQ